MPALVRAPMKHWKRWVPAVGSVSLIALVIWNVSPRELAAALANLNWAYLVPMSVALVAALYLWDSFCFWWLFKNPEQPISYPKMLRARGTSYLFTILNYGVGQGFLAYFISRTQGDRFLTAAVRCIMITYTDLNVLLLLGLVGGSLSDDPRTDGITLFCTLALATSLALTLAVYLLPARWLEGLDRTSWGTALRSSAWNWRELLPLGVMRLFYTSFGLVYVTTALAVIGLDLETTTILSVVPLVVLLDGLPISIGGVGTREAALLFLLDPPEPSVLLAFSLVWSTFGLGGRALIGLANLWLPRICGEGEG